MSDASSPQSIAELMAGVGLAPSAGQARRLIAQGAVTVDGRRIRDIAASRPDARIITIVIGSSRRATIVRSRGQFTLDGSD